MPLDDWEIIATIDEPNLVIGYPWHLACELEGDWTRLRLTAEGSWSCLGDPVKPCGPDGHPNLPLQAERLLVAGGAPGALIGKFGGSTAGRSDGTAYVIGSHCILAMPKKENALLFIGINGAIPGPSNVLQRIKLEIRGIVDQ
jgi:hypothetical protein